MNTVILTKVKVKSITDADFTDRSSNELSGDTIWLGAVYVYDDAHNEILETFFSRE